MIINPCKKNKKIKNMELLSRVPCFFYDLKTLQIKENICDGLLAPFGRSPGCDG